jgi:hypothetical protein
MVGCVEASNQGTTARIHELDVAPTVGSAELARLVTFGRVPAVGVALAPRDPSPSGQTVETLFIRQSSGCQPLD